MEGTRGIAKTGPQVKQPDEARQEKRRVDSPKASEYGDPWSSNVLRILLATLYLPIYLGFWFHRSSEPVLFGYSARHWLLLALLMAPLVALARARPLERALLRRVAMVAGGALLALALAHLYDDATRQHRFDPYLQTPRTTLEAQYPAQKGEGVFRILALGGSTTRGQRLAEDERYPARLESLLRERHPQRVIEVLNVGQNWWTTKHSLINYVTYASRWDADLVLVMHGVNDLEKSFSVDGFSIGDFQEDWGHHYGAASGAALAPTFEGRLWRRWLGSLGDTWYSTLRFEELDLALAKYRSLAGFERNLEALLRYARADGARVMFVTQPSLYGPRITAAEDAATRRRQVFRERVGMLGVTFPSVASLGRAMDAVAASARRLAESQGALLVDAAALVPKDLEHHTDDVHLTPRGTLALAQAVADEVLRRGLLLQEK